MSTKIKSPENLPKKPGVYIMRNADGEIIYIGKENHPETEAALELSEHVHLIQSKADFDNGPSEFSRAF